jgi:hypothetical protein
MVPLLSCDLKINWQPANTTKLAFRRLNSLLINKPAVAARLFFGLCVNDGLGFYADRFVRVVQLPQILARASKTSSQHTATPGTPIACLRSIRCHRSNYVHRGFTHQTLVRPIRTDLPQYSAILRLAGKLSVASVSRRPVDGRSKVIERRPSLAYLVTATARTGKRPIGTRVRLIFFCSAAVALNFFRFHNLMAAKPRGRPSVVNARLECIRMPHTV